MVGILQFVFMLVLMTAIITVFEYHDKNYKNRELMQYDSIRYDSLSYEEFKMILTTHIK